MATSLRDAMISPNFPAPATAERDAIPEGRPEVPLSALIEELKSEGVEWDKLDERQQRAAIVYLNDELRQKGLSIRGETHDLPSLLGPGSMDPESPYGYLSGFTAEMFRNSPLTDRIEKYAGGPAVSFAEGDPGLGYKLASGVGGIFGMLSNVALTRGALSAAGLGNIASSAAAFGGYEAAQGLSEGERDPAIIAGRAASGAALGGLFEAAPIARRALTSRMGKTGEAVEKFAASGVGKNAELAGLGVGFTALQPDAEFEDYLINALSLPIGAKILGVLAGGGGGESGKGDAGAGAKRHTDGVIFDKVRYELPSGKQAETKAPPEAAKQITSYVNARVQEQPRTVAQALGRPDMRLPVERPLALEPPKMMPPGVAPAKLAPPALPEAAADLPATKPVAQAQAAAEKPQTILDKLTALREQSTIDRDLTPEALEAQEAAGGAYDGTSSFEGTYGQALFEQGAQTPGEARRRRMEESRRRREQVESARAEIGPDSPRHVDAVVNESIRASVAESGVSGRVRQAVREFGVERLDHDSVYVVSHADGGLEFLLGEGLTKADVLASIYDVRAREAGAEFRDEAGRAQAGGDVTLRSFGTITKQDLRDIRDAFKGIGNVVRRLVKRFDPATLPEYQPLEDVPLDKAVAIFRRTGNFRDLMNNLPDTFDVSPRFSVRLPAIKDVDPALYNTAGRNYFLQAAAGGIVGGGADSHIGWVNRNIEEASRLWADQKAHDVIRLLNDYDIKPGSGKSRQLARMAGDPKMQDLDVVKDLRNIYDGILNEVNSARIATGRNPIPRKTDYVSHMRRSSIFDEVAGLFGESLGGIAENLTARAFENPHAKRQVEKFLNDKRHITDIAEIMRRYIAVSAKDIFNNLAIAHNKPYAEAMRAAGLKNTARQLEEYTQIVYGGGKPWFNRALKKAGGDYPVVRQAFEGAKLIKRLKNGAVFTVNLKWSLFTQPLSTALTFARTDADIVPALRLMADPAFRKWVDASVYSYRTKKRGGGGLIDQDWSDKNATLLSRDLAEHQKIQTLNDFARWTSGAMERALTMHAVAAGVIRGQRMGLSGRALIEYASDLGGQTQSFYDYNNTVGHLQSREFSSTIAPFSTGLFEIWNTLGELSGFRRGYYRTSATGEVASWTTGRSTTDLVSGDAVAGRSTVKDLVVRKRGAGPSAASGRDATYLARAKRLILLMSGVMVGMYVRDKTSGTGMNPLTLHPLYGLFFDSDASILPAAELEGFRRAVSKAIKYDNYRPMMSWMLKYAPGGVQVDRTMKGYVALANDGWVVSSSGKNLYRVDDDDIFEVIKALTTGVETTEAGQEYYEDLEFITIPKKKKKSSVTEGSGGLSERRSKRQGREESRPSRSGR